MSSFVVPLTAGTLHIKKRRSRFVRSTPDNPFFCPIDWFTIRAAIGCRLHGAWRDTTPSGAREGLIREIAYRAQMASGLGHGPRLRSSPLLTPSQDLSGFETLKCKGQHWEPGAHAPAGRQISMAERLVEHFHSGSFFLVSSLPRVRMGLHAT